MYFTALLVTSMTVSPILWLANRWELLDWRLVFPACVVAAIAQAITIRIQRIGLSPSLLRCADFWGRYHTISLDEITAAKPVGLFPFRFLQVEHDTQQNHLWLPLFLERPHEFWELVEHHTDNQHPLHAWAIGRHDP